MLRFLGLLRAHPGPDIRLEAAAVLADVSLGAASAAMGALSAARLVESTGPHRYRLLDQVPAGSWVSACEIAAARRRVIEWYLQGSYDASQYMDLTCHHPLKIEVSEASVRVPEFLDRQAAAAWYEQEWANLVAAVETAAECGFLVLVWQLAATMRFVFMRADRCEAGMAVQRRALRAAQQLHDLWATATILDGLCLAYMQLGQGLESQDANAAAIAIWQEIGDGEREAISKTTRSLQMMGSRDWARSVGYIEGIIAATADVSARRIYGVNLGNLGECMLELGDLDRARALVSKALGIHREFGWDMGIADTLWNLSRIMRARTKMADALPYAQGAVEHAKRTTDANLQGRTMLELAVVLQANRRHDESAAAYQDALEHARLAGDKGGEARVLERAALLHHERRDLAAARAWHEQSIALSREIGDRWYLALSLERFAETLERLGREREAWAARAESLALFKEFDEPAARSAIGRLSVALGD